MKTFQDFGIRVQGGGTAQQKTTCPRCSSDRKKKNDPCLSVNTTEGIWNCKHCGWSGSLHLGLSHYHKVNIQALPKDKWPQPTPDPLREKLVAYFASRCITPEVIDRNGVTMQSRLVRASGKERGFIAFAYYVDGEVANVKYRDAEKNFTQEKGGSRVFYKIDDVTESEEVIICEGEIDALSFEVAGYANTISVPDGAPPAEARDVALKMQFFDNCIDRLSHVKKFILATDNDAPGLRLRDELARRFGKEKCWIVSYPNGCKDANDVLKELGSEGVQSLVARCDPYPVEGAFRPDDFKEDFFDVYEHGYPKLAGCGDPQLDQYVKFAPGTVTVISGVPSHGKSSFADNFLVRNMVRNDWVVSYFTPENHPLVVHLHRLSEILIGKSFLSQFHGRMTKQEAVAALRFLQDHVAYIHPMNEAFTIDRILEAAAYQVRAIGINALVIDPWNRILHQQEKNETTNDYTARMINALQSFARLHGIYVFMVAHPRKMERDGFDGGNYKVPGLYDINDSSHWFNMPDYGLVVYRRFAADGSTEANEVYVRKVKHTFYGETGVANYNYDRKNQRFIPVGVHDDYSWIDPTGGSGIADRTPIAVDEPKKILRLDPTETEGLSQEEFARHMKHHFGDDGFTPLEGDPF